MFPGSTPRDAFTQLLAGNVYVRFDPDTEDVVGFEIVDFRARPAGSSIAAGSLDSVGTVMDRYGIVTFPASGSGPEVAVGDIQQVLVGAAEG